MLNQQQVLDVTRNVLQVLGTFLTTYGVINAEGWQSIVGVVLMIVPVVWGLFANTRAATVATMASMPKTDVAEDGKTIKIFDPALQKVAKESATPLAR